MKVHKSFPKKLHVRVKNHDIREKAEKSFTRKLRKSFPRKRKSFPRCPIKLIKSRKKLTVELRKSSFRKLAREFFLELFDKKLFIGKYFHQIFFQAFILQVFFAKLLSDDSSPLVDCQFNWKGNVKYPRSRSFLTLLTHKRQNDAILFLVVFNEKYAISLGKLILIKL